MKKQAGPLPPAEFMMAGKGIERVAPEVYEGIAATTSKVRSFLNWLTTHKAPLAAGMGGAGAGFYLRGGGVAPAPLAPVAPVVTPAVNTPPVAAVVPSKPPNAMTQTKDLLTSPYVLWPLGIAGVGLGAKALVDSMSDNSDDEEMD